MIRLAIILACLVAPLRADELAELKVKLAIAEVRAQRLESLLHAPVEVELPEVPDLTPETIKETAPKFQKRAAELKYTTRQVVKYRTVRVKHCNGRRCWYTTEQQPYTVTEQVPVNSQAILDNSADTYGTPLDVGGRIIECMRSTGLKSLADLGSGDGRMVVNWAIKTGYPAVGIEQDAGRVAIARNWARSRGVSHLATIIEGDFNQVAPPAADIVYVYQFPEDMAKIRDKLTQYKLIVSYAHEIPGLAMTSHNGGEFYSWRKPQSVVHAEAPQRAEVVYGGKLYWWESPSRHNLPKGGRCNCSPMCQTIKAGLRAQGANI